MGILDYLLIALRQAIQSVGELQKLIREVVAGLEQRETLLEQIQGLELAALQDEPDQVQHRLGGSGTTLPTAPQVGCNQTNIRRP